MRSLRPGIYIIIAMLLVTSFAAAAYAGPGEKVLVLPFRMHSATDISSERRLVMEEIASSLAASGAEIAGIEEIREMVLREGINYFDEEGSYRAAQRIRADFAVIGSLTKVGASIEADWRVVDLQARSSISFYHKSAASMGELLSRVRESAPEMHEKMASALKERPAVKTGIIDRVVISGTRRVDPEAVLKKIQSKAGDPFSPDDVKEDIRSVYGTGYFDDVTADLSDTAAGKVLTFVVREMPFIRKIEIKGNKELKEETIRTALTIKENTVLDRVILGENVEKIKTLYTDEGFYLAKVTPVVKTEGVDATVVFDVSEGEEVKVRRITFIGNKRFSSKELKGLMSTQEAGLFSFITKSGKFNEFIFQNDLAVIMGKYFDNGFINADIVDHRVLLSEDKRWFYITIAVTEGEEFRVGAVDVKGDMLTTKEDLLKKLKLKSGEVFNRSRLSKGMDAIAEVYGDRGYAYADIKPLTRIDAANKTVDLTLDIKKNDLVYMERIDISGNVRTRDKVIRRELELEEGGLFSASEFKRSRNNLRRLGYFEDVKLVQTQGSAPDKMKLDVQVSERPTGSISVGVGYSSVDKFIGTASIAQSNFMGKGLKLDLSATVSSSSSRYVLGFTEPWLFDRPISAGFDVYNTGKEYPDFEIRKNGFDLRFGFPLQKRYTNMFLTYKLEDVEIFNVAATASTFIKEQEGTTTESSVKALVRRDTRNDAFFPTEGSVLQASTEFAGGPLGGTSYFIKYEGEAVKFFPLPWDTSFSLRGVLGYLQGYQDHPVPIYERYFLGGINSLRGFETRSVGPKDPVTGEFIGGKTMMVMSAEFLFPLFPQQNVRGLLFFDAGNAYLGRIDASDIRYGAGGGIRWFSPIGPLRLELGYNLNRREGEKAQQWEFAIGTLF